MNNLELIAITRNDRYLRNVTVKLHENPIECDCNVYSLLRYLQQDMNPNALNYVDIEIGDLECYGPDYMDGIKIEDINVTDHKCKINFDDDSTNDACSMEGICTCWKRPRDNSLIIDCSGRNLTEVPEFINPRGANCVELDLSDNELSIAPSLNEKGYEDICQLNLAGNKISDLKIDNVASTKLKVKFYF